MPQTLKHTLDAAAIPRAHLSSPAQPPLLCNSQSPLIRQPVCSQQVYFRRVIAASAATMTVVFILIGIGVAVAVEREPACRRSWCNPCLPRDVVSVNVNVNPAP
jgi:hypothetical protein